MTAIRINKAHYPVTVLGPGRRIGIWLQGCSIGCKGCVSQDTWDLAGGAETSVDALLGWCRRVADPEGPAGVTISGGEPFDQPEALLALLRALDGWRAGAGLDFDIFCYSGYPLKRLKASFAPQLELIDLLCPEPYVDALPESKVWRGSLNQPLVPLTPRGARMAGPNAPDRESGKRFQVAVTDGKVWFIGIPDRGDMTRIEQMAASRGLLLGGVSWRT